MLRAPGPKMQIFILFACALIAMYAAKAQAHFSVTDKNITVTLHMDPDDDPIISQESALHFEIYDTANKFNAADCNCTVIVLEGSKQLLRASPEALDPAHSIYSFDQKFIFPEKGLYTIKINGAPRTSGAFQNFAASYDFRVDRTAGQPAATTASEDHAHEGRLPHYWDDVILGTGVLIVIGMYVFEWRKNRVAAAKVRK